MIKTKNAIKINNSDNVVVAVDNIKTGEKIFSIEAKCDIPIGHKMALESIAVGKNIIKYGSPIGSATTEIKPGEFVHTHNIKTNLSAIEEYTYNPVRKQQLVAPIEHSFWGFNRPDGQVGIRNDVWVISTVGCVNKIAEKIAEQAGIYNVYTFAHPYGCSQLGADHLYTQKILANMVKHPNAGGVLVLGLGCENNHIEAFKEVLGEYDPNRVKFLNTQDVQDEIAEGVKIIKELSDYSAQFKRKPIPLGRLIIGLKCGGSDGLSGITANPLVGSLSDVIISHGGTSILTEVPEMFGAETLLMNRATDTVVFDKTVQLINNFKDYFIRHGQEIYENPSPGNKEGGISTLEEKSLGCTQKGGYCAVADVLNYGERVKKTGLILLQGPGNDIVAVTNLTAAGAHIILFTTGRGTPLGSPVPVVKISSNNTLAETKPHWVDFNAGPLATGEVTMQELTTQLVEYIINVASYEQTHNEKNNYREISIWRDGVTL